MKIGLLGPYGFGNLGDTAIQLAMIEHIKEYDADAEIIGFCLNPKDTEERLGIPAYPISPLQGDFVGFLNNFPEKVRTNSVMRLSIRVFFLISAEIRLFFSAIKTLNNLDYLLISGGGQLDDYWRGAWGHPFTLFKWSVFARLRGAKLRIVSVGAGPINADLSKFFLKTVLNLADYRSFRDEDSKLFITSIGFDKNDPVYQDLAFSVKTPEVPAPSEEINGPLTIGIAPMAYFDPRVWPEKNPIIYADYLNKLAQFSVWLLTRGHKISLLSGHIVQDRRAINDLKEILKGIGIDGNEQINDPPIQTVDELLASIAHTDITIASRYHCVLFSLVMHRPVLALSYHRKIDVLMKGIDLDPYSLPINTFDLERLKIQFSALEADRNNITKSIQQKTSEYRTRLDEQYELLFS